MHYLAGVALKRDKPEAKPRKLRDGGGMFLHIAANGSKLWRYQYRHNGKAKLMALGIYPDVSLAQARERHQEARKLLADGQDPMADRKTTKQALDANAIPFQSVFKMWFEWWKEGKAPKHAAQVERRVAG